MTSRSPNNWINRPKIQIIIDAEKIIVGIHKGVLYKFNETIICTELKLKGIKRYLRAKLKINKLNLIDSRMSK